MMKWTLASLLAATAMVRAPQPVEACGVKLIQKNPGPGKMKRKPVKAQEDRPVVAARQPREPIAVGPPQPERPVVAAKEPEKQPEPPTPEPTPPPVTPPPVTPPPVTPPPQPRVAAVGTQELYFAINSSSVSNKKSLDKIAKWMAADASVSMVIEGHADPSGNPDANLALSQTRAESVRDYLVSAGVDASRLEVQAYGDKRLRYGRADGRNRRVLIKRK